jgi:hypothetical protein
MSDTTPLTPEAIKWGTVVKGWYREDVPTKSIDEAHYFVILFAVLNKQLRAQFSGNPGFIASLEEAVKREGPNNMFDLHRATNFFSSVLPSFEWGPAVRSAVLANIPRMSSQF